MNRLIRRRSRLFVMAAMTFALVSATVTGALAMGVLSLPPDPVSATHGPWNGGTLGSTIDITLIGVPAGYDVTDGTYAGWCAEDNGQANFPPGSMFMLLDSTDQDVPWYMVNYLLNHKAGTAQEVQAALWLLTWGSSSTFPVTAAAQAMYDDAIANGADFVPAPGQVVAVILDGDGIGPDGYQDTLIEVPREPPPPPDGEGCTPGFWRNPKKFDLWPVDPDTLFYDVFGVGPADPLRDTIRLGGGGEKALIRHGTGAYLNALSPDVAYFYTPAEVIAIVQDAYATGNFLDAKNLLEAQNDPTFCPLSN